MPSLPSLPPITFHTFHGTAYALHRHFLRIPHSSAWSLSPLSSQLPTCSRESAKPSSVKDLQILGPHFPPALDPGPGMQVTAGPDPVLQN